MSELKDDLGQAQPGQLADLLADGLDAAGVSEKPGDRIGPYKLIEQIGEGGYGVVYMAEQSEPIRRRVALKVIKLGMDTRQVVGRFEAERQALALMDHPNIAKVLDAGATATGRPYFVMELVRGVRITDYCDQHKLSTEERLKLFMQVCQAVQHAHQKGIIHRDLKPSNILVTLHDGVSVPKVIDFGIAKATSGQVLTDKTVFTSFQQFIGTPAYMSPEQAELSVLDIDTRSDIYSLGVLLYELLTGRLPFETESLLKAGLDEMRRIIREEEPPKPSTRLSTTRGDDLKKLAQRRHVEAPKLISLVRGDLDLIVMKCLEKDRTRRFETACGLAEDVQRHLANEPVKASPPSATYRIGKLIRRNRALLLRTLGAGAVAALATSVVLVALGRFYGKGPLKSVVPSPRIIKMIPRVVWEQPISGVYEQDHSVTGPGVRMLAIEPYVFVRVKPKSGGWRAFDLTTHSLLPVHQGNLAYVYSEGSTRVIELALEDGALTFGTMGARERQKVLLPVADLRAVAQLIAVPRTVHGLVIGCLPDQGLIFAFEEKTGRLAWKTLATDRIRPEAPRTWLDQRIGNITADDELIVAGMWSSRVWAIDASTGQHRWTWAETGMGNSIHVLAGTNRIFGFSGSGRIYALDKSNGALAWQADAARCDDGDTAVLHSQNLVLCPGSPNAGSILALSQADGKPQWKTALLGAGWARSVSCAGDFLAVSTGKTVQRFDPTNGDPGTSVELPTVANEVVVWGRPTSVFISHPLLILNDGEIVAFTIDGSLWGINLPPGPPQDRPTAGDFNPDGSQRNTSGANRPFSENPRSPREGASANSPMTPFPPLPPALAELEKQLARNGQQQIWDELVQKMQEDWEKAGAYARVLGGAPHVVVGRLEAPDNIDPEAVTAQMRIFKQGYFSTPVRDLRGVVSFRHLGCLPLDVSLAGTVGGLIYVGEVQLKPAAPGQVGGIRGRLAFPGASNLDEAVLSISVEMGKTSTASGGSEPPGTRPVPILRRAGKDGAFLLENLAPTPHFISIECPSALKKVLWGISIEPGTVRDLGQINLERPLQVAISWFTAPTPSFEQARLEQTKVIGDGEWQAQPRDYGFDLRLEQQEGRLLFSYGYGPCRLTDLGERELDAKVSINTDALLFRKPRGEVQAGHVYLLHQQHFQPQYWVLFRIDSIGPSGEPEQSPKR